MARVAVLAVALVSIAGFIFLTLSQVSHEGLTVATFFAIFVIVMLVVGIVGSLRDPPSR
jgi:hypothetical protein